MLGGGEMIGYSPAMRVTPQQVERTRESLRNPERARELYGRRDARRGAIAERTQQADLMRDRRESMRRAVMRVSPIIPGAALLMHAGLAAYDAVASTPGQMSLEEIVTRNEGWQARVADTFGYHEAGPNRAARMRERADSMAAGGRIIEEGLDARYDATKAAAVKSSTGLDDASFGRVRARLGASVVAYARQNSGGWLTGNNKGFDIRDVKKKIAADLLRDGVAKNATEAERLANNDALISDTLRLLSPGLGERERAYLVAGAAAGGDVTAKRSSVFGAATARSIAEETEKMTGGLGISEGDLDAAQKKQLASLFAGEGPEANARRDLFQARALEAAGNTEAALAIRDRVERSGLSADKISRAEAGVRGFTESVSEKVMQQAGRSIERNMGRAKDAAGRERILQGVNNRARTSAEDSAMDALELAMTEKFGAGAAEEFIRGKRDGGSGVAAMQEYVKRGGKLRAQGTLWDSDSLTKEQLARFQKGELRDEDIEEIATGNIQYRAKPLIEGASTTVSQRPAEDDVSARMTEMLAAAAERDSQMMTQSFGKLDGAADKLHQASSALVKAAGSLAGKDEKTLLLMSSNEGQNLSSTNSMSKGH